MKPIGVVLAGCGFIDGAEIYEATITMLALDRAGVQCQCLAPDLPQLHVINHRTGKPTEETRNVLTEAARLARGKIEPLNDSWIPKLEAVIFPGGFGAAKNYCDFAVKGEDCSIQPVMQSFMRKLVEIHKPIGVMCISPLALARALKGTDFHPQLTVGAASPAADAVNKFGSHHVVCPVTDIVVDHEYKIVSCPAYMYDARVSEVATGIEKLVQEVLRMVGQ
jgi:enhancing lycopene biosynthesis protein 2